MLAKLFLVFLVGYASAAHYAWKPNTEYSYWVFGRTLSGLTDHDPTMSGILTRSELKIVPKTPEILTAKLLQSQYCNIQTQFWESWEEEVPESKCQYKSLPISEEPFEIHLQEGIIKDVVVAKTLKNWEANMIKSAVSQLQWNVNAKYPIDSEINVLPKGKNYFGVWKVMETTITGEFETTYVMKPEPEPVWPVLSQELKEDHHQNIFISKSKNFTNHGAFVGYHFGFGEREVSEPNTDYMGNFMNRTSISNAVIYGDLQDYVIKSANTSNVISISPLYNNYKSGYVYSKVSLVLKSMQPGKSYNSPSEPLEVGLIYQYDIGYGSETVESGHRPRQVPDEDNAYNRPAYQRLNHIRSKKSEGYHLDQSKLELDQPSMSMSYYSTGYEGKSIKYSDKVDVVAEAKKLAHEIGQDLQHPNELPKRASMAKFVILVRLCRQMNKEEMFKVAEELYTNEEFGSKVESWKAIRDAIAQAGSGPALLTIREWIKSDKVDDRDASYLVSRMSVAARHPTVKYLRAFQKLVEETVEKQLYTLNDTALISYGDLLHKVCVDKEMSYQHYPFHAYGSFYTTECQAVVKEYIRYLEQRLHKAVAQSDSHTILVYSVALGKVGHRDIYRAFEKYIKQTEEKRHQVPQEQQVTEFQRFVMVNCLKRFCELYPEAAREFLSSIYFSSSEPQELRTIAVYLIAFTEPDTSFLTALAQYTQIDRNEYVNSAVKSTIRKLIDMDYEPAFHAERYLIDEEYGFQYAQNHFSEYVRNHMDTEWRHSFWNYPGADHRLPKGFHGKFQAILGDAHFNLAVYDFIVSSLEETIHSFEHQTEYYHKQVEKKQANLKDEAHASHKIYETLGMNVEEREQFEGLARIRIADAFRHFTFNNYTVENITEVVRHWQQELKSGYKFSLTKWVINNEAVLSAPTEMGLPYSFSTAIPTLLSFDGKLQAQSQPEFSNGNWFYAPENIQANADVSSLISREWHSSIRFFTPFDHQDYVSGYTKKMQFYVPISAKAQFDFKNYQISWNLKAIQPEQDTKLFHFSTIPYNARRDLLSVAPVETSQYYTVLTQDKPHAQQFGFGKKYVGMQFQLYHETDDAHMSWNRFLQSVQHKGAVETFMRLFYDDEILYSKTEFWYKGSESVNREVKFQFKYQHKYYEQQQGSAPSVQEILNLPSEQQSRFQQVIEKAAAGIKSVAVTAGDWHIQFAGQSETNIYAGAAWARGPVDKYSRIIAYFHTDPKSSEFKPYHFALVHNGEAPNTNGLDYEYALQMNPKIQGHTKVALGQQDKYATIEVNAEFHKTQERVQYLKNHPEHYKCLEEIKQGNRILPTCANMTVEANLLDDFTIRVKYEGLSKQTKYFLQKFANFARPCRANEYEFEHYDEQQDKEIEIHVQFSPDLESANYTLEGTLATPITHSCENISINGWERQLFVLHPVFPITARLSAEAWNIDTIRPICVADKTRAATFDGKEYDAPWSNSWTVMLHYLPQFANQTYESDLKYRKHYQIREHAVLVRQENQGKAVKITLRNPYTEQKFVEVELKPTGQSNPKVKVWVDKQEVNYDQQKSQDFYQRAIRVYGLPNDEVKVEISDLLASYYVIADGQRVKLTATSSLFSNATRGICGNFNGMEFDDFLLPSDEISAESPKHFVSAYTLGSGAQQQQHHIREEHVWVPIPSFERIQELTEHQVESNEGSSCTAHRTLYFKKNGKDCFSVRAFPFCKPGCHPQQEVTKKIDLICVDDSSASQQWRRKAEAGDYLNFQHRQPNEYIETKIHHQCQH